MFLRVRYGSLRSDTVRYGFSRSVTVRSGVSQGPLWLVKVFLRVHYGVSQGLLRFVKVRYSPLRCFQGPLGPGTVFLGVRYDIS